jgi:tellurite resistance protein
MDIKPTVHFEHTHGVKPSPEMMMHVAQALLVIMGADGEVSAPEWKAFSDRARSFGYPEPAIEELKSFDFKSARLEDYVPAIKAMKYGRNVLFDAVKFARADGIYHTKERDAVMRLANLLDIDPLVVQAIEGLVESEDGLERARLAILAGEGQAR